MRNQDASLIRHYVGLARSANYLAMCCSGNAPLAKQWRWHRDRYIAAARTIKCRSTTNAD